MKLYVKSSLTSEYIDKNSEAGIIVQNIKNVLQDIISTEFEGILYEEALDYFNIVEIKEYGYPIQVMIEIDESLIQLNGPVVLEDIRNDIERRLDSDMTVTLLNNGIIKIRANNKYYPLPSNRKFEFLRREFPKGCRIELDYMDDIYAPPIGTKGTVIGVDDAGNIMVKWDNGSGLSIAYGADKCHRI